MNKTRVFRSVRMVGLCLLWTLSSIYWLRFTARRTQVDLGYEMTTGEGILAYYAALVFAAGGSLLLVSFLYFLDRNAKHPIPGWLFVCMVVGMLVSISYFSPPIPTP